MILEIYMKKERIGVNAIATYNTETKETVVKKGTIVSPDISTAKTFKSTKSIIKSREGTVDKNNTVIKDVSFKSSSTAGNYVTGRSTDGMTAWVDKTGRKLKDIIKQGDVR